jgi:hypothetical protein
MDSSRSNMVLDLHGILLLPHPPRADMTSVIPVWQSCIVLEVIIS